MTSLPYRVSYIVTMNKFTRQIYVNRLFNKSCFCVKFSFLVPLKIHASNTIQKINFTHSTIPCMDIPDTFIEGNAPNTWKNPTTFAQRFFQNSAAKVIFRLYLDVLGYNSLYFINPIRKIPPEYSKRQLNLIHLGLVNLLHIPVYITPIMIGKMPHTIVYIPVESDVLYNKIV